jgi:hypothetical protein
LSRNQPRPRFLTEQRGGDRGLIRAVSEARKSFRQRWQQIVKLANVALRVADVDAERPQRLAAARRRLRQRLGHARAEL